MIDSDIVIKASRVGDFRIIGEIMGNESIGTSQKEDLLKTYTEMIELRKNNRWANISKHKEKLYLKYDIRKIEKTGLSKPEIDYIMKKAKEAKDLGIAKVKTGVKIGAKWLLEDAKQFLNKFGIDFWDKNKSIGDGGKMETHGFTDFETDELDYDIEEQPVMTVNEQFRESYRVDVPPLTNSAEKEKEELARALKQESLTSEKFRPQDNMSSVAQGTIFAEAEDEEKSDNDFEIDFDD